MSFSPSRAVTHTSMTMRGRQSGAAGTGARAHNIHTMREGGHKPCDIALAELRVRNTSELSSESQGRSFGAVVQGHGCGLAE